MWQTKKGVLVFEEWTIENDVKPYRQIEIMMRVSYYIKLEEADEERLR